MSNYRKYIVRLVSSDAAETLHLKTFNEVTQVLDHLVVSLGCDPNTLCTHSPALVIQYERVWFVDGFVSPRPDGVVTGVDSMENVCPAAILGVLRG